MKVVRQTRFSLFHRSPGWLVLGAGVIFGSTATLAVAQSAPSAPGVEAISPSKNGPISGTIRFSDEPNFTVAGVTDWTAVGGHGSDASLRTTEALTRETIMLKADDSSASSALPRVPLSWTQESLSAAVAKAPESFTANHQLGEFYLSKARFVESAQWLQAAYRLDPSDSTNGSELAFTLKSTGDLKAAHEVIAELEKKKEGADLRRLSGEIDEQLHDPLAAVHEFEQAVRLDPRENNYFEWGAELLLHRAVWQAQQVFALAATMYPRSTRVLTGLGTSYLAGGLYDQAAARLCEASDLTPKAIEPYIFLGRVDLASPKPLPCVEDKLAHFVQEQPNNALANYYYALALAKRQGNPGESPAPTRDPEAFLIKAVTLDPSCAEASLQLGIRAAAQRDLAKAIQYYRQAIASKPDLGEAHYRLGVAYDRQREATLARIEFDLHDKLEAQQAAEIEQQRHELKQFLVVLHQEPGTAQTQ